jgi:hypothetical protein|tara:strand:- start:22 stop:336 length:315 start_codon:yes stop_codon:yes gene_type:complete
MMRCYALRVSRTTYLAQYPGHDNDNQQASWPPSPLTSIHLYSPKINLPGMDLRERTPSVTPRDQRTRETDDSQSFRSFGNERARLDRSQHTPPARLNLNRGSAE